MLNKYTEPNLQYLTTLPRLASELVVLFCQPPNSWACRQACTHRPGSVMSSLWAQVVSLTLTLYRLCRLSWPLPSSTPGEVWARITGQLPGV